MDMQFGNQNDGWYPSSRSAPRGGGAKGSSGKSAGIAIGVILVLGLISGVAYYYTTKNSTPATTTAVASDDVKFMSFGPGTTDTEASSNDAISFTVPNDVNYTLLGDRNGSTPVVVQPMAASVTSWLRASDSTQCYAVQEVGGSDPGRGIMARFYHSSRQLAKVSSPNMPYIVNSKFD
ncbi:hypothetical protein LSH36_1657g00000 [Paralvinella palmiformis]|uniref:Uncharacterized protein n=1 Tax=Paralvinella palmiformis TaxID=53620 RepID=A0AAD9IS71_9ANNE|nr:hypothetical protein LSH36_1657g00000 [Paralvinella palmiformis]